MRTVLTAFVVVSCSHATAQEIVLSPVKDGQVHHDINQGILTVGQVDGQHYPAAGMIPSPPQEMQVILEWDLAQLGSNPVESASLKLFMGGGPAYSSSRLEIWHYEGNGVVDVSDFDANSSLVGTFAFDSVNPGQFPQPDINQSVEFDVTQLIASQPSQFAGFNVRLTGEFPDFGGNVFDPNNPFRFFTIAASEASNMSQRPRLTIQVPEPTTCLPLALSFIGLFATTRKRGDSRQSRV